MTTAPLRIRAFTITLPDTLELLNANQRLHHAPRARITSTIRAAAMEAVQDTADLMTALAAAKPEPLFQRAHILGVLHPNNRQRRDPANWYPSFKAAVDGLVDSGVLEDDDHTRLVGPDMRLGSIAARPRIVLHIRELTSEDVWHDLGTAVA